MIVTIFRNRLKPEHQAEYYSYAKEVRELAATMPGFIGRRASRPKMENAYQLLSLCQKKRIKTGVNILAIEWLKCLDGASSILNTTCKSARWSATTAIRSPRGSES